MNNTTASLMLNIPIAGIVELSTAHITLVDNTLLKNNVDAKPSEHPQIVMEYEHGFVVSAWHNFKDNPENFEKQLLALGHSPAYVNLVRVAYASGAKWLNLDCDAEHHDFLPVYVW